MKGKWMKIVRQYTIITLGISMMAVGVYFFKFPNNFVFGGVTGAAALAAKLTPISASEFSAVVNMLMLLLGLIFLGKEFALTTGYATVVLSAELMLLEKACPLNAPLSDQPMLELIFAIALPAIASALLFSVGGFQRRHRCDCPDRGKIHPPAQHCSGVVFDRSGHGGGGLLCV